MTAVRRRLLTTAEDFLELEEARPRTPSQHVQQRSSSPPVVVPPRPVPRRIVELKEQGKKQGPSNASKPVGPQLQDDVSSPLVKT